MNVGIGTSCIRPKRHGMVSLIVAFCSSVSTPKMSIIIVSKKRNCAAVKISTVDEVRRRFQNICAPSARLHIAMLARDVVRGGALLTVAGAGRATTSAPPPGGLVVSVLQIEPNVVRHRTNVLGATRYGRADRPLALLNDSDDLDTGDPATRRRHSQPDTSC